MTNAAFAGSDLAVFSVAAPRRLRSVVEYGRSLGIAAVELGDAMEAIDDAIWGEGLLPAELPWQVRGWKLAQGRALEAFREGAQHPIGEAARLAVEAHGGDVYRVFYATAWWTARFAGDDDDIARAALAALQNAGLMEEFAASTLCPIRRARVAQAEDDCRELASFYGPSAQERYLASIDSDEAEIVPSLESETEAGSDTSGSATDGEVLLSIERLREIGTPRAIAAVQAFHRVWLGMETPRERASPVDLWQRHEAPSLPRGILPVVVEEFAFSHAETMGADPAGLAMSALAVCSAAVPDDIVIQVKEHDASWREACRLWVGLVGMPSTKKTPLMNAAMRPLRRVDDELAKRYAAASAEHARLAKKDREASAPPIQRRHIVEDATIEALQEVLKDSPQGIISAQDELSGWFGAMDKYTPGKGAAADRAFWLKAFNGGSYSLNRIARGAAHIPNLSIGLLGGIQPEPLRKLAGDSVDDGLIQRFLPVILRSATVGQDAPAGPAVANYEALVVRLIGLRPRHGAGNLSSAEPVRFDTGARAVREDLEREHVALVEALETVSPKLAAHFGKHDGIFARLCLLWHCIEAPQGVPRVIEEGTAVRVAAFMRDFLRPSAIAFYSGLLGMSAGHEDLMALAAHIVASSATEVTARDVVRSSRALRHVDADQARKLCEKLQAFGWLEPIDPRQKSNSPRWSVEPEVHVLFAERGRQEAARRAEAQRVIQEAFSTTEETR